MTIINADAKGLEVVCAAYLSRDKIMMQEIINGVDIHGENQKLFNIPRLIAKVMKFRIIYGGTAYSFASDPDFTDISTSEKYWQKMIDKYYDKYQGLYNWHGELLRLVTTTGQIITPTGRVFKFEPKPNYRRELVWPITQVKNFPVQSFGADMMSIARISFAKRFYKENISGLIVNTVHDSIVCDVEEREVKRVARIFHEVFNDLPINFERIFKIKFDLPMKCEVSVGKNMKELVEIPLDS